MVFTNCHKCRRYGDTVIIRNRQRRKVTSSLSSRRKNRPKRFMFVTKYIHVCSMINEPKHVCLLKISLISRFCVSDNFYLFVDGKIPYT